MHHLLPCYCHRTQKRPRRICHSATDSPESLVLSPFQLSICFSLTEEQPSQRGSMAPNGCQRCPVCKRELLQGCFDSKIAIFTTALVRANMSTPLFLLIICKPGTSPIVSRLRSEEISLKSHRLNLCFLPKGTMMPCPFAKVYSWISQ